MSDWHGTADKAQHSQTRAGKAKCREPRLDWTGLIRSRQLRVRYGLIGYKLRAGRRYSVRVQKSGGRIMLNTVPYSIIVVVCHSVQQWNLNGRRYLVWCVMDATSTASTLCQPLTEGKQRCILGHFGGMTAEDGCGEPAAGPYTSRLGCMWVSATAVKPPTRTFNHSLDKTCPRPVDAS